MNVKSWLILVVTCSPESLKMKTIFLLPLIMTIASVNAGFLNGGHFLPATNVVASRTIIGSAVGGGPSSGAVSTAQYSQTVAAPATVHTVITSHPGTNVAYAVSGSSGGSSGNSAGQNSGGNAGAFGNYVYSGSPGGSSSQGSNGGSGGYGGQGTNTGGGLNTGFNQHPSSYYSHQRYY